MKLRLLILLSFITLSQIFAQVVMTNNIPTKLPVGSDVVIEVKINKGTIANFTKYHMDVPVGMDVSEVDSRTGNFTFENNRAKIVWVSVPGEIEFTIKMKVHVNTQAPAEGTIAQKFYFLDGGVKKEVEAAPITIQFGSGTPVTTSGSSSPETPKSTNNTSTQNTNAPATTTQPATTTKAESKPTPVAQVSSVSAPVATGLVYRVQLASSPTDPGRAKYSALGSNFDIVKEDGMYKVLYGSYSTKEEGLKAKDDLANKGFNGFLVKYQNGVRVK